MDAISLLKADHRKVERLFSEIEGLSDTAHASRAKLFNQIDRELTIHANIEETIFYPAFKSKTQKNTDERDEVLEAYEEHGNVKAMLKKIEMLEPADETYNAKIQVLGDLVKHHVKEEETQLFKQVRERLDESELVDLGEKMAIAKENLGVKA